MVLEESAITYCFSLEINDDVLGELLLVHLNVRYFGLAGCKIAPNNQTLLIDDLVSIEHSKDLSRIKEFEIAGSMGKVRYFQCLKEIEKGATIEFTTRWNFLSLQGEAKNE